MGSHAAVVDQIKGMQRTSEAAKKAWWHHADTALGGVRDPSRHDEHVLRAFLRQYQSGGMAQPAAAAAAWPSQGAYGGGGVWSLWASPQAAAYMGGGGGGGPAGDGLAGGIKEGQRRSQVWREAWQKFCAVKGRAYNDPARHTEWELVDFLDYAGELTSAGLDAQADQQGVDLAGRGIKRAAPASDWEPSAKRPAISGGADSLKTSLVVKVKELQRSSQEMKQAWWTHCDEALGGVRDPNRHDAAVLSNFLASMGAA